MKRIFRTILAAAAMAVVMTACTPAPDSKFVAPTPQSLQQFVLNTCGYLAEVGPLAQLIAAFVPVPGVSNTTSVVTQIGTAVCTQAMAAKPAAAPAGSRAGAASPRPVVVNGITVTGYYAK